jgi:hypothetical protein
MFETCPLLSANQMNAPGFAWAFLFEADGTSLLGPDAENKNGRRASAGIHLIEAPHPGIAEGNPPLRDRRSQSSSPHQPGTKAN